MKDSQTEECDVNLENKPVDELAVMARDEGTDPKTLDKLGRRSEWKLRFFVACNKNTLPKTLHYLATDSAYDVRHMVATNPNVGVDTLRFLVNDRDEVVAKEAQYKLKQRESEDKINN